MIQVEFFARLVMVLLITQQATRQDQVIEKIGFQNGNRVHESEVLRTVKETAPSTPDVQATVVHVFLRQHKGNGMLVLKHAEFEDRLVFNRHYGFRVVKKSGTNEWTLRNISSRQSVIKSVNSNNYVKAEYLLEYISLPRLIEDPSFKVDSLEIDADETKVGFVCNVGDRDDYTIKSGYFVVDSAYALVSYKTKVLYTNIVVDVHGEVEKSEGKLLRMSVSTSCNGQVMLLREITPVDSIEDIGIVVDDSPYWVSSYGFPEPPLMTSNYFVYFLFAGILSIGVVIVVWKLRKRS